MKKLTKLLCLILSLLLLAGCAAPAGETAPETVPTETAPAVSHMEETLAGIHALARAPTTTTGPGTKFSSTPSATAMVTASAI